MDSERIKINLEILSPSKKKPSPGDIFAVKPIGKDYYFGQVIKVDVDGGFGKGSAILIYIFKASANDLGSVPKLDRDKLLVPPMMVNVKPWRMGYLQFIKNEPLDDILPEHTFLCPIRKVYFDEYGHRQEKPVTKIPVGTYGLASYGAISEEISEALEIP